MEWKSSDARSSRCVYGKSFDGKAGFVSWAWFLHFANYRRDCYNFDSRFEEGLAKYQDDKKIHDTKRIPVMPPTLRGCANFIQRWIFANTPSGATSSAVIFSLIQTAIENVSDPYRYLSWLMSTAAEIDLSRPENVQILLPWNTPAECRTN